MPSNPNVVSYTAAGGVVLHPIEQTVLLLVRPSRNEIRLPKGHIDPGEDAPTAALREVTEESGYAHLRILDDLGKQLVAYSYQGQAVARTEIYFLMQALSEKQVTRPEADEAQFFPVWTSWEEAQNALSYEAEQEWLRRAKAAWDAREHPTQEQLTTILEINAHLVEQFGHIAWEPHHQPVLELVNTILSQNTNDRNRDIAFKQLRDRYPTWEAVRDAPEEAIIDAVRPAGLAPSKAPRIQKALRQITAERGEISLDFLYTKPREQARDWLLALDGVGPKTTAIVLLFAMGVPAFPVDTHVHRVTRRLGLIPDKTSREKAHVLLEAMVPEALYMEFHINVINLGRALCSARKPKCDQCPLAYRCTYNLQERDLSL